MTIRSACVIGLGYIGLPTAAILASRKVRVIGVDVNREVVETVNRGDVHIVEPGLPELVANVVADGFLSARAVPTAADVFIIAVPTPFGADKEPDLSYVQAATESVAPHLKAGDLIVVESTCPGGTTHMVDGWLMALRPDLAAPPGAGAGADVAIAYCPERVLPGKTMAEIVKNDRVIGGLTPDCAARAAALYRLFVEGKCVTTDSRTAEMCKLTENSFRDVNIAFANELSLICADLGIDVWELIGIANLHPRVNILQPGPGVGGHCIAVDPWFIVSSAPQHARLIRTAREVNDGKPGWVVEQVKSAIAGLDRAHRSPPPRIACFGLTFKPDVDDFRQSPAIVVVEMLAAEGLGEILVVDPYLTKMPSELEGKVVPVSLDEAFQTADVSVILVDHAEFKGDFRPSGVVVDCKGLMRGLK